MKPRYLFLSLVGIWLLPKAPAQVLTPGQTGMIETILESIEAQGGGTADFETVLNDLEGLRQKPIDLNTATEEDLQRLPFLTAFQIRSMLDYRKERGKLLSIYELPMVYGFSDEVVQRILPFVTVGTGEQGLFQPGMLRYGNHTLNFRTQRVLQRSEGYTRGDSGGYPGNPWLYSLRYGFDASKQLQAGFTLEKDPGETFFRESNRLGFDFMSAYLQFTGKGWLKTVVAGDYRLGFGQGLTLWSGSSPGKSALSVNIVKRQDAIRPYSSSGENDFFRGAAVRLGQGRFTTFIFASTRNRDANLTDTLDDGTVCFSSFQESGYHRTQAEIADEGAAREVMFGGHVLFRNNWLKTGFTVVHYTLNRYWDKGDDLKDVNTFRGRELTNAGVDYAASLGKVVLFGETAVGNGKPATVNGLLVNTGKFATLSLLYRYYPSGYFSMHSAAFSEGSSDSNEEGLYAGLALHPLPHVQVSGYADFFRFPWLRYRVDAPSSGNDYLLQVDYNRGKTGMFLRFRSESNTLNDEDGTSPLPDLVIRNRVNLRYHVSVKVTDRFVLQDRVEGVWVGSGADRETGWMVYQDLSFRFLRVPVMADVRFAWFGTDSYNARIYAYEKDLISGFSFSPLYDRGVRTYLMLRWDVNDYVSMRFRLSHSHFTDKSVLGTGLDEVSGSGKTECKVQLSARLF